MATVDQMLKAWRDYLDRSPQREHRAIMEYWREREPALWREFCKAGRYSERARELDR